MRNLPFRLIGLQKSLEMFAHLFLAEGVPVSEDGSEIPKSSPRTFAEWLVAQYCGTATIWAIPLRWVKSDGRQAAARLVEAGITRGILRSETDSPKQHEAGTPVDLTHWRPLLEGRLHALEAKVGTLTIRGPADSVAAEQLLRNAWDICGPDVMIELHDAPADLAPGPMGHILDAARHRVHPNHRALFRIPNRHLLSFNAPEHTDSGACPTCKGIGRHLDINIEALVTTPEKSLHQGAMALWTPANYKHLNIQHEIIEALRGREGFDPDRPWRDLPKSAHALILDGTSDEPIQGIALTTGKKLGAPRTFEGFRRAILRRAETASGAAKLGGFVIEGPCPNCAGTRWSPETRALHAAERALPAWLSLPMAELAFACRAAERATETDVGRQALKRLTAYAEVLTRLGLGHLSAERSMQTVSDGESRRLQIGATLAASSGDLMLLLDEPARGLHEWDLGPMISVLRGLGENHCVLLNEHRSQVVQAAERVLTLGPGSGPSGGHVVACGPANTIPIPSAPLNDGGDAGHRGWITICGASMHNVHNQDVRLPLGALTAIVGVSGSGKSSFARGVLIPALLKGRRMSGEAPEAEDLLEGRWSSVDGLGAIRRVHVLHQRVPPRNRRSLVVTMTGTLDVIAAAFAATQDARRASLTEKDFSLNSGVGRCPICLGTGIGPNDEEAPCPACGGRRYREAALSPKVSGLTIAETLDWSVTALVEHWRTNNETNLVARLSPLVAIMRELGLGHIALGRRVDSLSGGEIQRLRVALTIAGGEDNDGHLFFLDEPAAGLHSDDAQRLMDVLRRMVARGRNTVVIVEHNMHILRVVDWLVEFGPGAGPAGGKVVALGTPASIAGSDTPTGQALSGVTTAHADEQYRVALQGQEKDGVLDRLVSGHLDEAPLKVSALEDRLMVGRRLWEIGDLNLEVGKILLDEWDARAGRERVQLLAHWRGAPEARLVVNPALPEMRLWGGVLPRSVAKALLDRLPNMGLILRNSETLESINRSPAHLRAVFEAPASTDTARAASLDHALAIGGGFVELEHWSGRTLASVTTTPLDLDRGMVGPQRLSLGHLSRLRPEGSCLACRGKGTVLATQAGLLLAAEPKGSLQEAEAVLTPEASAILKGVWRYNARPFFRRLEEEGLAEPTSLKQYLLFGFWCRPGHGTFLKNAKDNPDEVGSWLRWDGLFTHIWSELPHSKAKDWARAVKNERYECACPICGASGHGIAAQMLRLRGLSLAEWALEGTVQDLRETLEELPVSRARQKATRKRLLHCLIGTGKLGTPAEGHAFWADVVRRAFVTGGV